MRKILLIIAVLFSTTSFGQVYYGLTDTTFVSYGLSTDSKPSPTANFCYFIEVNTNKTFVSNGGVWALVGIGVDSIATRLAFVTDSLATALAASIAATYATITTVNGKQATLVSATNIKTVNGSSVLGSGDLVVTGTVTSTAGVGTSPTSSSTQTITHNLGRVPTIIRVYGYGTFTSNAAATATTSSMGVFNSSGNFCVYQRYGAAITTTQAGLTSTTFAILLATGGGNFISGVIQNVTSTAFDLVWTESGTSTAQVYLWEAQPPEP